MRWRVAGLCLAALAWGCAGSPDAADEGLAPGQFVCTPGDGGTICRLGDPLFQLPETDLAIVEAPDGRPSVLRLFLERDGARVLALPAFYGSDNWGWCELSRDAAGAVRADRLVVADFNRDDRDDLALAAECMTGVGPTGARPFPVGTIWIADAAGGFTTSEAINANFTDLLGGRCTDDACDVAAIAAAARAPGG